MPRGTLAKSGKKRNAQTVVRKRKASRQSSKTTDKRNKSRNKSSENSSVDLKEARSKHLPFLIQVH